MDRLTELQSSAAANGTFIDIPEEEPVVPEGGDPLERCFQLVADIQAGNREIQAQNAEFRMKSAEFHKSFQPKEDGSSMAVQHIMDGITTQSKQVKLKLDTLQAETKQLAVARENAPAVVKIHENQHAHLTRCFLQHMNEFRQISEENEQALKDQTKRRIMTNCKRLDGGYDITEARAEEMAAQVLETGQSDAIFQESKDTLTAILETRQDLLRIERSMRELQEIFNDLAVLVNEQGELMDQVLTNVQQSVTYVEGGREQLKSAKKFAKKSRKKMCWMVVLLAIILMFAIAITGGMTA
jgi:syntaxin 1B/2/3